MIREASVNLTGQISLDVPVPSLHPLPSTLGVLLHLKTRLTKSPVLLMMTNLKKIKGPTLDDGMT